jgi:hypothetical protein
MTGRLERVDLGSARVSRAGESVPLSRTFHSAALRASGNPAERLFRRDAETNTRDGYATQIIA